MNNKLTQQEISDCENPTTVANPVLCMFSSDANSFQHQLRLQATGWRPKQRAGADRRARTTEAAFSGLWTAAFCPGGLGLLLLEAA